jgi:hypothetical protein
MIKITINNKPEGGITSTLSIKNINKIRVV